MPRRRERAQCQQVSAFEIKSVTCKHVHGRINIILLLLLTVGLRKAGLSYCDIAACTGHAAMTVKHVWNQWREEGRTQRQAGTGPCNVTTSQDDRMVMTDSTASSTVLSRRWSTATGLDLSASTVHHCLLRAGLVAHMPLHRLPLSRDHQCLRLQWACERRHWHAEWQNVVFSDESHFNMSYNDGCIRVQR